MLNPQRRDSDPGMNWVPGSAHFTLAPRTLGCLPAEASGWLCFGVITLETHHGKGSVLMIKQLSLFC